jgi:hypothetical protein
MEIQTSAKRLRNYNNEEPNAMVVFRPLLYRRGTECRHVMEKVRIVLENWP